jgi:seryl-tRNA synthetase
MSDLVTRTIDLSRASEAAVQAVLHGLALNSDHVLDSKFHADRRTLEVQCASNDAADRTASFVAGMLQTHRRIAAKVLFQTESRENTWFDVDQELSRTNELLPLGPGLAGIRGGILQLFRFFEHEFLQLAKEFHAEEQQYPTLLPAELVAELGYLGHFPQHVTFCSHLPDDLSVLDSVARVMGSPEEIVRHAGENTASPQHVLTPGVCLPCYRQLRGTTLAEGEVRTLTMQNHVFRYESNRFRPMARGWDFTVRDIVFFGTYADMQTRRQQVLERTLELCRALDLTVTVEVANDPFFLDANRDKTIFQRMGEVKYELLFPLPFRDESLAASSFNLHRDFYTSVYGTQMADGNHAESSCIGFGLDRWTYGFLSQKGLHPERWPQRVRNYLRQ